MMEEDDCGLGYKPQKEVIYNKLLPYSDDIGKEILEQFSTIKKNLSKAVILRDIRPGCIHWVAKLSRFVILVFHLEYTNVLCKQIIHIFSCFQIR